MTELKIIETIIPCVTCGKDIDFIGREADLEKAKTFYECTNCWEVEHRLNEYAQSENGRKYMKEVLSNYIDD